MKIYEVTFTNYRYTGDSDFSYNVQSRGIVQAVRKAEGIYRRDKTRSRGAVVTSATLHCETDD